MQGYENSKTCFEMPWGVPTIWHTQFLGTLNFETFVDFEPISAQWAEDERLGFRMTVIQIAATDGDLNIIKIIAPIVKNPNEIGDNSDFGTPIHYAAGHGHLDIIKFFISFIDIDNPFIPDQWWFGLPGYTPIMYAAFNGHIDVLKLLAPISKNPNEETNEDYDGNVKTPIQLAQERGHHEFAKLLQSFIKTGNF